MRSLPHTSHPRRARNLPPPSLPRSSAPLSRNDQGLRPVDAPNSKVDLPGMRYKPVNFCRVWGTHPSTCGVDAASRRGFDAGSRETFNTLRSWRHQSVFHPGTRDRHFIAEQPAPVPHLARPEGRGAPYLTHPGVELRANLKSISHRCYLFEVAFVWELTEETIHLPMGCFQGGLRRQSSPEIDTSKTVNPRI